MICLSTTVKSSSLVIDALKCFAHNFVAIVQDHFVGPFDIRGATPPRHQRRSPGAAIFVAEDRTVANRSISSVPVRLVVHQKRHVGKFSDRVSAGVDDRRASQRPKCRTGRRDHLNAYFVNASRCRSFSRQRAVHLDSQSVTPALESSEHYSIRQKLLAAEEHEVLAVTAVYEDLEHRRLPTGLRPRRARSGGID